MNETGGPQLHELKTAIRKQAHENRKNQADKDGFSIRVVQRFLDLPEYHAAKTVMFYVDVREEVRTRQALPEALKSGKRIVVPYCVDGELELFWLESMEELELGMYKILEPKADLRTVVSKRLQPEDLDLVMVPGVALIAKGEEQVTEKDTTTNYCSMLAAMRPLIALSFECQLFEKIPAEEHDIYMDKVVTEDAVYTGRGRPSV